MIILGKHRRRLRGFIEWGVAGRWVYRLHPCGGPRMTMPTKVSTAAYVLQHLRFRAGLLAAGLALTVPLWGCDLFHKDFDIAVGNRMANTVSIFSNGGKIGDGGSNQTPTLTVAQTPSGRTA